MKPAEKPRREKTYVPAFDLLPETGKPENILQGFAWLRLPLPFELNHINLWLMEGKDGHTIVDTGFNFADTLAAWENIFATRFASKPVENIFITHFHPDHFGLAGWLAEKTGVTPHMTAGEYAMARHLINDDLTDLYHDYFIDAGVTDATMLEELLAKRSLYKKIVYSPPAAMNTVRNGDIIPLGDRSWEIVTGNGHCPEHACLYNAKDKLFISGDIVLPDISPNISFFPGNPADHNPVDDYLKTLDRVQAHVPDDVIVFPSHGVPFKGLHRRIDELKQHHDRRFARMRDVMQAGPQSALQIMQGLFSHRGMLKGSDLFFGLGETLAHLVYETERGTVKKADGVYKLI